MSVSAYILIQTKLGQAPQAESDLTELEGVLSTERIIGPYDLIVRAQADSFDRLGKTVVGLDGVSRVVTCPLLNGLGSSDRMRLTT